MSLSTSVSVNQCSLSLVSRTLLVYRSNSIFYEEISKTNNTFFEVILDAINYLINFNLNTQR